MFEKRQQIYILENGYLTFKNKVNDLLDQGYTMVPETIKHVHLNNSAFVGSVLMVLKPKPQENSIVDMFVKEATNRDLQKVMLGVQDNIVEKYKTPARDSKGRFLKKDKFGQLLMEE